MNGASLSHAVTALFDAHRLIIAALIHLDNAAVHTGDLRDLILPDLLDNLLNAAQRLQAEAVLKHRGAAA